MVKILTIENDKKIAMLIDSKLMNLGYNVMLTCTELIGERFALKVDYDMIIADVTLSKINGLALCRKTKAEKPDTPILLLKAFENNQSKVEDFNETTANCPVHSDYEDLVTRVST